MVLTIICHLWARLSFMIHRSNKMNLARVRKVLDLISRRLDWRKDFQRKPRFGSKIAGRVVELQKRLSDVINRSDVLKVAKVWNVKPDVISGRLLWFTDFQRKRRFRSKSLRGLWSCKRNLISWVFFLSCFVDSKAPVWYHPKKASHESKNYLSPGSQINE